MNLTKYLKNRLDPLFGGTEYPETKRKILLMTHVVVGYPSLESNWKILFRCEIDSVHALLVSTDALRD